LSEELEKLESETDSLKKEANLALAEYSKKKKELGK
jgi:hypothetical protein